MECVEDKSDVIVLWGLVTARVRAFYTAWSRFIWVVSMLRKRELQNSSLAWTIDVVIVDAVLKSSRGRILRLGLRMCIKQERGRWVM